MHVVIDDGDTREASRPRVCGSDGNAVEEAEAHRFRVLGMVSRWTHERECACAAAFVHHVVHRGDRCTCRRRGGVPGMRRRKRVRIQRDRSSRRLLDHRDVLSGVNAADLSLSRGPGLFDRNALLAKLGGHGLHDFESLDAFGMPRRGQMVGEDRRCEKGE